MSTLTPEALEAFGFREYPVPHGERCDRNWCYTLRDKGEKKLHVHVRFWQHSIYPNGRDGWDACAQFENEATFNVDRFVRDDDTPEKIVAWFESLFDKTGCIYYEELHG